VSPTTLRDSGELKRYLHMSRRKRIKWVHGDIFAVPLADGSFGIVQAVDHWMPHWVYTAVTDLRMEALPATPPDQPARVISLIAVSDDEFNFGAFTRIGASATALAQRNDFPNERFAGSGYVGAKSYTGGIVVNFLSAWHGLASWTVYKDPEYFDKLLVQGIQRPPHANGGGR
jgi:hypothetical protein